MGPALENRLAPAPTRLRQIALVTKDLERAKGLLVLRPSGLSMPEIADQTDRRMYLVLIASMRTLPSSNGD
jgi:hypothetical protein